MATRLGSASALRTVCAPVTRIHAHEQESPPDGSTPMRKCILSLEKLPSSGVESGHGTTVELFGNEVAGADQARERVDEIPTPPSARGLPHELLSRVFDGYRPLVWERRRHVQNGTWNPKAFPWRLRRLREYRRGARRDPAFYTRRPRWTSQRLAYEDPLMG